MLWKYGAVRMPPFHHMSKLNREIAPGFPSALSRWPMAFPTAVTPRTTSGRI